MIKLTKLHVTLFNLVPHHEPFTSTSFARLITKCKASHPQASDEMIRQAIADLALMAKQEKRRRMFHSNAHLN